MARKIIFALNDGELLSLEIALELRLKDLGYQVGADRMAAAPSDSAVGYTKKLHSMVADARNGRANPAVEIKYGKETDG